MIDESCTCNICVESFNATTRMRVVCINCQFECCKVCFRRYITDVDSQHVLRCMKCGAEFNRTFLFDVFGKTFMSTTYRDIRQNLLYDIEKGYFPATQDLLHVRLKIDELREQIPLVVERIAKMKSDKMERLKAARNNTEMMPAVKAIDIYLSIVNDIENLDERRHEMEGDIRKQISRLQENKEKPINNTYVTACPNPSCNGMISNENCTADGHRQCIICRTIVCQQCTMQIAESDTKMHKCDPDTLKSIELINNSSKPCPTCNARIHKIIGCAQMFCTVCKTSFNWITLKINNGKIHNPHHAQWLMETANRIREPGDLVCGRELDVENVAIPCYNEIMKFSTAENDYAQIIGKYLCSVVQWVVHHNEETIRNLSHNRYSHETNQNLRMELLLNNITEASFKQTIQRIDKANAKREEILNIVITFRDIATEIIWPYFTNRHDKTLENWEELYNQLLKLESYINSCFGKVADIFGSRVHNSILDYIH